MEDRPSLQERDVHILEFIAKFAYCQLRHVCYLFGLSARNGFKIVTRLKRDGWLNCDRVVVTHDYYLSLTANAAKFLGVKHLRDINLNTLRHDMLLVDLYFHLKPGSESLITDKELRRLHVTDMMNTEAASDKYMLRIPDLLLNDNTAIELELTEKPKARLLEIVNSYIVNDEINEVHYYCQAESLINKIGALSAQSSKFKFFLINVDDEELLGQAPFLPKLSPQLMLSTAVTNNRKFGAYEF